MLDVSRFFGVTTVAAVMLSSGLISAQNVRIPRSSLKVNVDVAENAELVRAREFLKAGRWEAAVEAIRRVSENEGSQLMQLDEPQGSTRRFHRYVTVRQICHRLLAHAATVYPLALEEYRRRVDTLAQQWWEQAVEKDDPRLLEQIVDQVLISSYGDDALLRLGELALERGQFSKARGYWLRLLAAEEPALVYPDTDINRPGILARLIVASILEGSMDRARADLAEMRNSYPQARGNMGGRTGIYVEQLARMLEDSATWLPSDRASDWPTFAGLPDRTGMAGRAVDVAGDPVWSVRLREITAGREVIGFGRRRVAEGPNGLLSYHPVVVNGLVFWNDSYNIFVHRAKDDQALWGGVGDRGDWHFYPRRPTVSNTATPARSPRVARRAVGVPRFTMTANGHKLFARLGDPVTSSREGDDDRSGRRRSFLVGLDLLREGRLLPGFRLYPDDVRWEFEGAPICHAGRLFVAMRRSTASGAMPEMHVACYELATSADGKLRRRWRRKICAAETPAGSRWDERSHCLLSLHEETIYCNTNAGAVAALRADSGQLEWVVRYPRATLRPRDPNRNDWHYFRDLNPCVCYRDRVIVAPTDSDSVFALDATTGRLHWENRLVDVVHLLGVASGHLLASGVYLYWLDVESGRLACQFPEPQGKLADGMARPDICGHGRGIVTPTFVYWPTRESVFVFSHQLRRREAGRRRFPQLPDLVRTIRLDRPGASLRGGNLVMGDGILLIAASDQMFAFKGLPLQNVAKTHE